MTYQFKITLAGVASPKVYRQITVPAQLDFHDLHRAIQIAFGWGNYHLYQFETNFDIISHPGQELMYEHADSTKVKLKDVFSGVGGKVVYTYDFGDDWKHIVEVEEVLTKKTTIPAYIGGKGTCPPEDCGGTGGFDNFKKIIKSRKHKEHQEMREWVKLKDDEEWDTDKIDVEWIKETYAKVF